ncbi:MAG: TIGR00159 family protein [Bacteriovoracaceae bacterium]|nr:TIGR00159 family protein [Bacteriovoracaceae bacterium]
MKQILSFVGNISFTDLLDIFVVSIIVYRFFRLIQGTRAVQIIIGLVSVCLLYFGSIRYQLYTLNWLLTHFFEYFFLILIILFQDQIRNTLVMMGRAYHFRRQTATLRDEQIEEVVAACGALSRERTGALILFEKTNGLLNFTETGTKLNCDIHSDIIYSLFQNNSPLHDGAVIISDKKILAAGCFIPLSKNIEIDRHYGTRHRAALGVSEITDAVVVIVSEESGKINICFNGIFYLMSDEAKLRKYLRKFIFNNTAEALTELKAELG